MADHDVKIKISEDGADKTIGGIGSIAKAFKALSAPLLKLRSAAAALFRTLGTVSFVIHGISLVIGSVKRLHEWMESNRKAAAEMANARIMDRFADSLNKAAERAKRLKEETAETLANLKEMQQRETADREAAKGVKSAELNLEEQRALSGVTDAEDRQRISDDFKLRRADLEASGKAREAVDTRRAINLQINAALGQLGKEERYRAGREPERERMYQAWWNWKPQDEKTKDEFAKRQQEIRAADGSLSDNAVREKALGQMEEAQKRKAVLDKMDEEIAASDERTKELNRLVDSRKSQRARLDQTVQESELRKQAAYQEVANAQELRAAKKAEEDRKAVEEFVALSEKSARKYDKERAEAQIDEKEKKLSAAEGALKADPSVALASDRITAMGGFATAGAAAISGIAAGPDRTYQELRAQKDLLKQEIEQLKKIVRNTEDAGATFQ
ncbi:MAG: hypothetical protein IJQ00_00840 [Kiritimatiellae bacterium]|nr:hypothetical protein [Kiritimatiellia bacterium]